MSLAAKVRRFLSQERPETGEWPQPPAAALFVVAVSGGADSLSLLHLLAQQKLHPAEKLIAATLDHGWRPEAAGETQFVREAAAAWGVKCVAGKADTIALARERGLSLEAAGRQARYDFLAGVARQYQAAYILTAHHADDQAETLLLNLIRGAGLAGLTGMSAVAPVPGHPDLTLLRPLLEASREEIMAYCRQRQLAPLIDPSNEDPAFRRNRVRHELLPLLERYNPQIRQRLCRTATLLAADEKLLAELAAEAWTEIYRRGGEGWLALDRAGWRRLPLSLQRRTLRLAAARLRPQLSDMGFETIEQARLTAQEGEVGAMATLPAGLRLCVGYDLLEIKQEGAAPPVTLPQLPGGRPLPLSIPGELRLAHGWRLSARWLEEAAWERALHNPDPWQAYLDLSDIDMSRLQARPRLPGERFQPLGMAGRSVRVKEFMIDRKIPAALRDQWPIIAGPDHLLWIAGHHIDERVKATPTSRRILHIRIVSIETGIEDDIDIVDDL